MRAAAYPGRENPPLEDAAWDPLLRQTLEEALRFLHELPERRVGPAVTAGELREALGGPVPEGPTEASEVLAHLARAAGAGLVATPGPRYFGFVTGGSLPAAVAADWLASAWDQNAGLSVSSPAAGVVEEVTAAWLAELLGLPPEVSAGFVTGGQMANVTGLAAARHQVLAAAGWDVERRGLIGAPAVRVVAGEERHVTVDQALRLLGLGSDTLIRVPADGQGRMRADALADVLDRLDGDPLIVCGQAGNVNTGACDPVGVLADLTHGAGGWFHIDGAFGLWAAASEQSRSLVEGVERADSWATDGHKWLNVPYDSGLAFCAHPRAHRAAMSVQASYLVPGGDERDSQDFTPEASRRARALPLYAALRSLGRSGLAALVERCCALARRFATSLGTADGIEVCNDVALNQVLVRFWDHDARTREVIRRVQAEGTCWMGGTTWHDQALMRISVSNWSTTEDDVDRSVEAILRCASH
ncbi:MAG: pyridoxal phosphate-dependent decarboxylase family protein [Egibacteraceae bacterium]